jgi:hypothetical protein
MAQRRFGENVTKVFCFRQEKVDPVRLSLLLSNFVRPGFASNPGHPSLLLADA